MAATVTVAVGGECEVRTEKKKKNACGRDNRVDELSVHSESEKEI